MPSSAMGTQADNALEYTIRSLFKPRLAERARVDDVGESL